MFDKATYQREYQRKYWLENKEELRAYYKEWREKNKKSLQEYEASRDKATRRAQSAKSIAKHRDKRLAEKRAARLKNLERERIKHAEWRKNNRERAAASIKAWKLANPEHYRTILRNQKARRKNASGKHTAGDIVEIFHLQRGRCAYCRSKLGNGGFHVDHIVAIKNGGSNDRSNLQILCQPCNLTKGARDPIVHARTLGLLV